MEEDELERTLKPIISPIAYAFESICRGDQAVRIPLFWDEELVGNTTWCKCGWCATMPPKSICCQEADAMYYMVTPALQWYVHLAYNVGSVTPGSVREVTSFGKLKKQRNPIQSSKFIVNNHSKYA